MAGPLEEFLDADGNPGADRVTVTAAEVATCWKKYSTRIPPMFAVGAALHETTYTLNERDTEDSGKQTGGIFMLTIGGTDVDTLGDATLAGYPEADIFTLDGSCKVFAVIMERKLDKLIAAAATKGGADVTDADFFAAGGAGYLAWAHNAGLDNGQARTSIQVNGLSWMATRARNAGTDYFDNHIGPYGDDCISGGPDWTPDMGAPLDAADAPLLTATNEMRLRIGLLTILLALLAFALVRVAPRGKAVL
jgi:hypothetical protein